MTICTPWRVAMTLDTLLGQINQAAPERSTASDGSIGDSAHQAQGACGSQHNSCCIKVNGVWIVRARDFTQDPAHGADMAVISEGIRVSRDWRARYVIFNRRYFSPNTGWAWAPYTGSDDPHTNHMHVSTWDDAARFDNTAPWQIGVDDVNTDQDLILRQSWTILRQLYWMWAPNRAEYLQKGGVASYWDYGGGLGDGNKMTRDLQKLYADSSAGMTKIGEGLTVLSGKLDAALAKLDGIAAGGGLTDADRQLMNELMAAVNDLNSRLASP